MQAPRDVLIVDDDEDTSSILAECLRTEGYTVRVARNGALGLERLEERLPDVVVLDVEMPVLDGPGMAHRMFVEDCGKERIPIVLVSGAPALPRIVERVGTPYCVRKPFDLETVVAALARALAEGISPVPASARSAAPGA